jgi:hypothetical protein
MGDAVDPIWEMIGLLSFAEKCGLTQGNREFPTKVETALSLR